MEKALQSSAYKLTPKAQVGIKEFSHNLSNGVAFQRYSARNTDVPSITGLKVNIAQTRAGTLDLTLSSLEYCENVNIDDRNRPKPIVLKKAYYFLQTINNTEYIYIEGESKEKNSRRRCYRLPMDEIKLIECVFDINATTIRPPHCNCRGEDD